MTIRPATAADQATIRQMVHDAGLDPTGLRWRHFLIAEDAGQIVGIGQVRPATPELGSLVVREERRGEGIGGALVRALLAQYPAQDVYLECAARLTAYYERFGFEEIRWQAAPMPLKLKAGLGNLLLGLFGQRIAVMVYRRA